ncbi:MAG: recombinase family protein [Acutalibacteraceae bacterium]
MQRLLREVSAGQWDGVLVVEIERLARGDTEDQGAVAKAFQYSGTKIVTPLKTYDPGDEFDEEYFEFGLYMSRRELKTINRRLVRGRQASAKQGKYVGSVAPFGYEKAPLTGQKGFTLIPSPDAAVVQLIFRLFLSSAEMGTGDTATQLNQMGYRTRQGHCWSGFHRLQGAHQPGLHGQDQDGISPQDQNL